MGQITQVNPEALNVASQMILKEIDLTGTDAERKAKLDQFEADWKALTGSDSLDGARFVGRLPATSTGQNNVLLTYNWADGEYKGLCSDDSYVNSSVSVSTTNGSLFIAPLFQHLEAITIYVDNTPEHMQQNLDNIAAYEANLQALGVDTSYGFSFNGNANGYTMQFVNSRHNKPKQFFAIQRYNSNGYFTTIDSDGRYYEESFSASYTLKSLNAKSLEAITIRTGNTDAIKLANKTAIEGYVNNLKALGVDVTKGYYIPFREESGIRGFLIYNPVSLVYTILGASGDQLLCIGYMDGGHVLYTTPVQLQKNTNLTTTSKQIVGAINEVNAAAKGVKALGAIELKADDKAANKTALAAFLKVLTDAGIDTSNGYSTPIRITGNSQEYFGTLNIGTGTLLSGVVTDINESHHYPCNVNISDGELTFSETNYFLEKTSNEVVEMLDAIKYSHTPVPFTETTLSNKAQLEVFLSKVPDAQVMHCTYKGVYAGTLHKINGDWYGMLVKNTNDYADNLNVKLQADGTLIEGTTSVQSINAQLDAINGEVK